MQTNNCLDLSASSHSEQSIDRREISLVRRQNINTEEKEFTEGILTYIRKSKGPRTVKIHQLVLYINYGM